MTEPPSSFASDLRMPPEPQGGERHHAKKSLGQNFLLDRNLQRKIASAIHPAPGDEILEIGPGWGALTDHLVGRVRRLIVVELDDLLAARLAERYAGDDSVTVLHQDFLDVDLDAVTTDPASLKVIGNIPYNITTPIIFHLLERRIRPRDIVLMVQREVADRILAPAGGKTYGALAVGVQAVAHIERVLNVGRFAFRPAPDVDSTVIRITPFRPPALPAHIEGPLRTLTRIAFGKRRKQFQRILRDDLGLSLPAIGTLEVTTGFDLRRRPETFTPAQFSNLTAALVSGGHLAPSTASDPDPVR
jgi:16S rRNA (adenine1518-N6/adenine1519-N6)-dimethyltransferase